MRTKVQRGNRQVGNTQVRGPVNLRLSLARSHGAGVAHTLTLSSGSTTPPFSCGSIEQEPIVSVYAACSSEWAWQFDMTGIARYVRNTVPKYALIQSVISGG